MIIVETELKRILAYRRAIDMRKSFDGLVSLVRRELEEDPLSGTLFVFVNKRGNYLKSIYWDRTGYVLLAKRLERGRFKFPGVNQQQELSSKVLKLIMDGIDLGGVSKIG